MTEQQGHEPPIPHVLVGQILTDKQRAQLDEILTSYLKITGRFRAGIMPTAILYNEAIDWWNGMRTVLERVRDERDVGN